MKPQQPEKLATAPTPAHDIAHRAQMTLAWKSYRGELPKPLKAQKGQPDDNVLSNRCQPIVDKGVSFLFGQTMKIDINGMGNQAQEWLDHAWGAASISDDDDRMTLLSMLAMNGGVCGQAFLKIIPANPDAGLQYPRLVALDPQICRVITSPDDCDLVLAYIIEYDIGQGMSKRQVYCRCDPDQLSYTIGESDLDDTWQITTYIKTQTGAYIQQGQPVVWPYPFAPLFACQNLPNPNEWWGTPDLTPDLIETNKAINFVQSNVNRIGKIHAHPKVWTAGLGASQISVSVDDVICLPSPDAKLSALEAHGDLANLMAFAGTLRSDMDEQSRIPAVALGRLVELPKGNISGVALQLLFQPLIEKTIQKQRLYGRLIREVSRALMVIGGFATVKDYQDTDIELHWQNLLPVDDLAAAQTALALQQLGVSNDTILQNLGYDADAEADKSAKEDAKKMTMYSKGQGMPPGMNMTPPNAAQDAQKGQQAAADGGNE
jgi:hypothetical protein